MELILISVFGGLILAFLFILLIVVIKSMNKNGSSLSGNEGITQESLKLLSEEMKNFTMEKNENIKNDLKEMITSETNVLPEIRQKIENVNSLLFQNNKAGKAGEYLLERIFNNISGELNGKNILAQKQYQLIKKGENGKKLIVDLLLKGEGSKFPNIAIDSKLSVKSFDGIINNESNETIKQFKESIRDRIKETSKYVSVEDNIPYAIMFIPSESIATYISNNLPELFDQALDKRVILASPSSLASILFSVENYMSLFQKISGNEKIIKAIGKLQQSLIKNDEYFFNLKKAIDSVNKSWKNINENFNNLDEQYRKIKGELDKNDR